MWYISSMFDNAMEIKSNLWKNTKQNFWDIKEDKKALKDLWHKSSNTEYWKNLIDLEKNAKKYKSFDEFKKSVWEKLYHGTNSNFDEFSLKFFGSTDQWYAGKGIYLTANKKYAKSFWKNIVESYPNIKNPFVWDTRL